ncbi:hypothetical protein DFH27DRAFT_651971 [Peziza echinospora]|nr:hypothetical protein DFH27DRAFT_651971 [Peziza echinospora]
MASLRGRALPNIANLRKQRQRRSTAEPVGSLSKEEKALWRRLPFVPPIERKAAEKEWKGEVEVVEGKGGGEEWTGEVEWTGDGGGEEEWTVAAGRRPEDALGGPGGPGGPGGIPPPHAAPLVPGSRPLPPTFATLDPAEGTETASTVVAGPTPPTKPWQETIDTAITTTTSSSPSALPSNPASGQVHRLCRDADCPSGAFPHPAPSLTISTTPTAHPTDGGTPYSPRNCTDNLVEYDSYDCSYNSTGNGTDYRNNPGALEVDIESEYDDFMANKSLYIGVIVVAIAVAVLVVLGTWWGVRRWHRNRGDELVDDDAFGAGAAAVEKKRWRRWRRSKRWHEKQVCTCQPTSMSGALGGAGGIFVSAPPPPTHEQQQRGLDVVPEMSERPISAMLPPPLLRHQQQQHQRSSQLSLTNSHLTRSISSSSSAISSPPSYHHHNPHLSGTSQHSAHNTLANAALASRSNSTRTATSSTSNVTDDTVVRSKREYQRTVTRLAEENMYSSPEVVADGWRCAPPNPFEDAGGLEVVGGGGAVGVGGMGQVDELGRSVVGAAGRVGVMEDPFSDGAASGGMGVGVGDGFAGYVPGSGGGAGGVGGGMHHHQQQHYTHNHHHQHQQLHPQQPSMVQDPFADEYGMGEHEHHEVDVGVGDGFGGYVPGGMMGGGGGSGNGGEGGRSVMAGAGAEGERRSGGSVRSGVSSSATLRGDLEEGGAGGDEKGEKSG